MSAEVICLSSSDEDASCSSRRSSSSRVVVKDEKSVNKSTAAAAGSSSSGCCDGGGKKGQKRHLTADDTVAAPSSASCDHPPPPHSLTVNSNAKKLKVDPAGCSSKAVGAVLPASAGVKKESQVVKPQLVVATKIPIPPADEDVFQKFVAACRKRRDDKETKQVLLKLEKLYSKLSTIQKQDNEFRLLISSCHSMVSKGLSKDIYTPILEVHTEIKRLLKIKPAATAAAAAALEQDATADKGLQQQQQQQAEKQLSKGDKKKIKLLQSSIKECLQKIKELEEKEVDFDDDADSAYIQEDKYKKRLIQLYNALSKETDDKILRKQLLKKKIKRNDISDEMTGIPSVDEAILNFVNSDISKIKQLKHLEGAAGHRSAKHVKMPEYLDILACVTTCNNDSNLKLSKEKMEKLAKRAFTTVGHFLKKKRMDETKLYIQSYQLPEEEDPAIKDVNLNRKLRENKKEGDRKLEEIFKKYVDKQEGLSQEDMEEQQHVSSDIENGSSSSSSSSGDESDTENVDAENKQVRTKKQAVVGSNKGIINSSRRSSDDVNEGKPNKAPIVDGDDDDDDDDLLLVNDRCDDLDDGTTDPLDISQVPSPAAAVADAASTTQLATVQNELLQKLQRSNEILLVKSDQKSPPQPQVGGCLQSSVGGGQQQQVEQRQAPAVKAASAPPPAQGSPPPPHHKPETTAAAAAVDTAGKENEVSRSKTPVIKVRAFAKPPLAWGSPAGSSPEKVKKISPSPKVELQSPPPAAEFIDLTEEEGKPFERLPARSINPLAKRTTPSAASAAPQQPVKRVVIVKNVINNYHVPLSDAAASNSRRKNTFHSSRGSSSSSSSSKDNNRRDASAVWLSKEKGR